MTVPYRTNERIVRFDCAGEIGHEAGRIADRYSKLGLPTVAVTTRGSYPLRRGRALLARPASSIRR